MEVCKIILPFLTLFQIIYSQSVQNVCFCVVPGSCTNSTNTSQNGEFQIDIRIQTNGNPSSQIGGSPFNLTFPASTGINYVVNNTQNCQFGLQSCCPTNGYQCGMRNGPIPGARQPTPGTGQTVYGSHPWTAVITTNDQLFVGTGVLIDHLHVLTVAHKVNSYRTNPQSLLVLLGEWEASGNTEVIPVQQFSVSRLVIHNDVNFQNLRNNVAILRLINSVPLGQTPTIVPACLPNSVIRNSIRCWVAGWGVSSFNNSEFSQIQREVDIQLLDPNVCQNNLRNTRLGPNFIFDSNSFLCGGGEPGKDACTGDGGAPLVCSIANRWFVVGLVAWGISCGQANVPGVYVNVSSYVNWIQQTIRQFPN